MIRTIALLALAALVAACASTKAPQPKSAEYYFSEGERLYKAKLYEEAIDSWEKVRTSYDSLELVRRAELKIAEAHFEAGDYMEAAVAYESFLKNHPDDEKEPEVLFQLGLSYYRQILSADRDQIPARNALATLKNYLMRFPDHADADEARRIVEQSNQRLAAHEIYVGRFYLRTDEYQAAINRLEPVPKRYPDSPDLAEAWYYLGVAYLNSGNRQAAVEAFDTLFEDYPDSPFVKKGRKMLDRER